MGATRLNDPGRQLKKIREKLSLKFRDVTEASQKIAKQHSNSQFTIGLSRLADIENNGTIPSIYRLYSLAAIYGMDVTQLLTIFGVHLSQLPADSFRLAFTHTREARFEMANRRFQLEVPAKLDESFDPRVTSYMSRQLHRWGKLPVALLHSLDLRSQRYAFIGTEDLSMYPLIRPASFVQIDETKRLIKREAWLHEYEKPIYFLEHRNGFRCGWCTQRAGFLIVESHPASAVPPEIYKYPGEVDVLGQVVGIAMRLDREKRHHIRS